MGGGNSKKKLGDDEVEIALKTEALKSSLRFKILILGAGESGKSTVLKQIKFIWLKKTMNEEWFSSLVPILHSNTIVCMQVLISKCSEYKLDGNMSEEERKAAQEIGSLKNQEEQVLTPETARSINTLWVSDAIQETYARRAEFWLLEAASWYFDNAVKMSHADYTPSEEEVVMARKRTTGVVSNRFEYKEVEWEVVDVGGQRSERRKWIQQFADVSAIVYVVNLAGYNSVLFEDPSKNRMQESLELIEDISKKDVFKNTPIFLFLNKKDLFEATLKTTPLSSLFPDYKGHPTNVQENIDFITQKFASKLRRSEGMVWSISARFKQDVRYAFRDILEMLLKENAKHIEDTQKKLKRYGMDKNSLAKEEEKEKKMREKISQLEEKNNENLDRKMAEEAFHAQLHFKLLCLGPGESGKSTVIKQLHRVYLGSYSSNQRRKFVSTLHTNTIQCMQTLLRAGAKYDFQLKGTREIHAAKVLVRLANAQNLELTPEIAEAIEILWKSKGIQDTYAKRHEFWLLDGAKYYFEHCREFAEEEWLPSDEDMIMARARTTGLVTTQFQAKELKWSVVDVGGQRSERKKWINAFDQVKAIVFVVNLAGYNSVLFEDPTKNRLEEALDLFEEVCSNKLFKDTPIYLFLNKKDLFEGRLRETPLTACFPDFKGDATNVKQNIDFVTSKFKARMIKAGGKGSNIQTWPVAARYKKDIKYAFLELTDDIIQKNKKQISDAQGGLSALRKKHDQSSRKQGFLSRMIGGKKPDIEEIEFRTRKVLLVGTSGAGKSSTLRQLRELGFSSKPPAASKEKLQALVPALQANALLSIDILINEASISGAKLSEAAQKAVSSVTPLVLKLKSNIEASPDKALAKPMLNRSVAKDVATLWRDPAIQELYRKTPRSFWIYQNAAFFLDNVTQFVGKEWIPSFDQTLKVSIPTTKLEYCDIYLKQRRREDAMLVETTWKLVDLPGKEPQRLSVFEDPELLKDVTAVVFVAGLTDYYEPGQQPASATRAQRSASKEFKEAAHSGPRTRLEDSLDYFKNIAALPSLSTTPLYLVLNKLDLFEQTLRTIPITSALPEYKGSLDDVPQNLVYISNQYWNCLQSPYHKEQWEYWTACSFVKRDIKWVFTELVENLEILTKATLSAKRATQMMQQNKRSSQLSTSSNQNLGRQSST